MCELDGTFAQEFMEFAESRLRKAAADGRDANLTTDEYKAMHYGYEAGKRHGESDGYSKGHKDGKEYGRRDTLHDLSDEEVFTYTAERLRKAAINEAVYGKEVNIAVGNNWLVNMRISYYDSSNQRPSWYDQYQGIKYEEVE